MSSTSETVSVRASGMLAALFAVGACSIVTSFDDIDTSGRLNAGPTDAGGEVARDSGNEVLTPTDSGALDAGSDGCPVTFCDDFGAAPIGATWDPGGLIPGAFSLDTMKFRSAPSALRLNLSAAAPDSQAPALVKRFPSASAITAQVALSVTKPVLSGTGFIDMASCTIEGAFAGTTAVTVAFGFKNDAPYVVERIDSSTTEHPIVDLAEGGAWWVLTLEIAVPSEGKGRLRVLRDTTTVFEGSAPTGLKPGPARFVIGGGQVSALGAEARVAHYDDVAIDIQP